MNRIIEDGVVQNALSAIEHENKIGAFSFFGTGSILCGRIETGAEVFIDGGLTVKPGTKIGARRILGTGAALIKDADSDSVYVGNPAKKLDR
jgi:acetyltransferase-like isoleucine patch superfamily enzyme